MNTPAGSSSQYSPDMVKLKQYLISQILGELESKPLRPEEKAQAVQQILQKSYQSLKLNISNTLRDQLFHDILDELVGFGPIQHLLDDPEVSEIMVNGASKVYVERNGKVTKTNVQFDSDDQVLRLIDRIILPLGRRIDADSPTVDARLPDGSRVNAVIPPVAIDGPTITIRKFQKGKLSIDQLIDYGSITKFMAEFIRACVIARFNIIISGGTGSGKTTLLNVLSSFIPEDERIITIEDAAELKLQQDHVVRLETKTANSEGKNAVVIRDLVRNALRMRPERIIVGEVRGGEAFDLLQALNTGHSGTLSTIHANSAQQALARFTSCVLQSGVELPYKAVRHHIADSIHLLLHLERQGGRRVATEFVRLVGYDVESDRYRVEP